MSIRPVLQRHESWIDYVCDWGYAIVSVLRKIGSNTMRALLPSWIYQISAPNPHSIPEALSTPQRSASQFHVPGFYLTPNHSNEAKEVKQLSSQRKRDKSRMDLQMDKLEQEVVDEALWIVPKLEESLHIKNISIEDSDASKDRKCQIAGASIPADPAVKADKIKHAAFSKPTGFLTNKHSFRETKSNAQAQPSYDIKPYSQRKTHKQTIPIDSPLLHNTREPSSSGKYRKRPANLHPCSSDVQIGERPVKRARVKATGSTANIHDQTSSSSQTKLPVPKKSLSTTKFSATRSDGHRIYPTRAPRNHAPPVRRTSQTSLVPRPNRNKTSEGVSSIAQCSEHRRTPESLSDASSEHLPNLKRLRT